MITSIIGLITGGVSRLLPEVLSFINKKADMAHEIALGAQQIELAKVNGAIQQSAQVEKDSTENFGTAVAALQEAYKSMQTTGVKWVDALNGLIRPYYTIIFIHVWLLVKLAAYNQLIGSGITWDHALTTLWTEEDQALFAAIANFWFLGRVFDKVFKR